MADLLTTREVADILGTDVWRVRRLYEDGTLPEPGRLGRNRMIRSRDVPRIRTALADRGWLPTANKSA